jgi:hypothetical protein
MLGLIFDGFESIKCLFLDRVRGDWETETLGEGERGRLEIGNVRLVNGDRRFLVPE